ncbi:DUF3817 domain-containing protein [Limnoglobus roseus]|uniref:DUF3817 domain-containing protein n=1 Tax=Limnoglobus roseus TaxID=2598579 RepID=A0A5C1AI14_9BACT|nr:DUF3817 domain-containing protein [Limnoglobus roseus]QEL18480.1 hypothetical protein PX52LOC_05505 [Limnoglobus roseus]
MPPTLLGKFRLVALTEGVSYLLILLVTWPLKEFAGMRWPNLVVGMTHGILFLVYCALLCLTARQRGWPWKRVGVAFAASIIPTGTFFLDPSLRREMAEEVAAVKV